MKKENTIEEIDDHNNQAGRRGGKAMDGKEKETDKYLLGKGGSMKKLSLPPPCTNPPRMTAIPSLSTTRAGVS